MGAIEFKGKKSSVEVVYNDNLWLFFFKICLAIIIIVDDCYLCDAFFLKKTNFNLPFIVFNKLAKYQYHVMNTYIWTKTLLSHLRPTRFNVSHTQRLDV